MRATGPRSRLLSAGVQYGLLSLALLVALIPSMLMILTAFKTQAELSRGVFSLPEGFHPETFYKAWEEGHFGIYFRSSLIVTAAVVGTSLPLTVLSGYAFGRYRFRGQRFLFVLVLLGMMMPMEAVIIPLYYHLRTMGLLDTYWALILPQVAVSMSFGTFWMRAFFLNVPPELVDASIIDGCSSWDTLWRVLLPLARPAVMTLAVLFFIWTWNEFLMVLVLVSKEELRTLPTGLAFFQGRFTADVTGLAAGTTIVSLPTIFVYILFQRHFIRGIMSGGIHG